MNCIAFLAFALMCVGTASPTSLEAMSVKQTEDVVNVLAETVRRLSRGVSATAQHFQNKFDITKEPPVAMQPGRRLVFDIADIAHCAWTDGKCRTNTAAVADKIPKNPAFKGLFDDLVLCEAADTDTRCLEKDTCAWITVEGGAVCTINSARWDASLLSGMIDSSNCGWAGTLMKGETLCEARTISDCTNQKGCQIEQEYEPAGEGCSLVQKCKVDGEAALCPDENITAKTMACIAQKPPSKMDEVTILKELGSCIFERCTDMKDMIEKTVPSMTECMSLSESQCNENSNCFYERRYGDCRINEIAAARLFIPASCKFGPLMKAEAACMDKTYAQCTSSSECDWAVVQKCNETIKSDSRMCEVSGVDIVKKVLGSGNLEGLSIAMVMGIMDVCRIQKNESACTTAKYEITTSQASGLVCLGWVLMVVVFVSMFLAEP